MCVKKLKCVCHPQLNSKVELPYNKWILVCACACACLCVCNRFMVHSDHGNDLCLCVGVGLIVSTQA